MLVLLDCLLVSGFIHLALKHKKSFSPCKVQAPPPPLGRFRLFGRPSTGTGSIDCFSSLNQSRTLRRSPRGRSPAPPNWQARKNRCNKGPLRARYPRLLNPQFFSLLARRHPQNPKRRSAAQMPSQSSDFQS
jgi:hypothetical protein